MEALKREILKYNTSFSEAELNRGLDKFEIRTFKTKEYALREGEVCEHLFFSLSSIVKCFSLTPAGEDHVLWMKSEQMFFTEYKSFVSGVPSMFNLQFYEDSEVFCISRKDLMKLYSESTDWSIFGINLTETVHVTLIDVFVNLLSNDATRNYQYIAYAFPRFLQVAPLKDIASMLQVTPVTLSRIRAGKQVKSN